MKLLYYLAGVFIFVLAIVLVFAPGNLKNDETILNFGFEDIEMGLPTQWRIKNTSAYSVSIDSLNANSGKYSLKIESTANTNIYNFQTVSIVLPYNYSGQFITLSGYIKTENVTDGHAGLWMRIDPLMLLDNMHDRGVTGTTGWQKYEITFPLSPERTKQIIIGGLLIGNGKVWLDDFSVTIDGKDISKAEKYKRPRFPSDKDNEFDNGSRVDFPELTGQKLDDLELLGKLWGFMKYHHPAVAAGKYNWDYELFRFLPKYLKVENEKQRDDALVKWIDKYGKIPVTGSPSPNADAHIRADTSWIEQATRSSVLKDKLRKIYSNRNRGENYYVNILLNPMFTNEDEYDNMSYPDAGFRLLALYRYWSSVEYFFPEKHITDKPWGDLLREYIPVFLSAGNELEYEIAALRIIGDLCDTHAFLWEGGDKIDSLRGNYHAPFRVQFIEDKLVVTDYYNPEFETLVIGDVITHIDGRYVEDVVDSLRRYYPASNEAARLRDMSVDILRSPYREINVNGNPLRLYHKDSLNIYNMYKVDNSKCYRLLEGNIGYVTLANIKNTDIAGIKKEFVDTPGIIIDMRNYPSANMMAGLAPWFVTDVTPFVKFSEGSVDNPGEFRFREPSSISPARGGRVYKGKVVVIVNEMTQSQAECTAMAFRAGANTVIIGSQTAGADGDVSTIFLPGGLKTVISGRGVYYPDGTPTQRIGIVPDIEVKPTLEGIAQGRDELLERAIKIINE